MDYEVLKALGIKLDNTKKDLFEKYIKLFFEYNSHTNLISKKDETLLFEKHIFDSLAFNLFIRKYDKPEKIMDMGTGGGFPSLPLAILFPETEIYAVDSTSKKIEFLNLVKENLKLANLHPTVSRIEELPNVLKENFDVVTSRALGALPLILEYSIPYLKTGGYFVAYKSMDSENELSKSKNALEILKTEFLESIQYKLPVSENFDRKLLVFKKLKATSSLYPRTYNIMKKSPL